MKIGVTITIIIILLFFVGKVIQAAIHCANIIRDVEKKDDGNLSNMVILFAISMLSSNCASAQVNSGFEIGITTLNAPATYFYVGSRHGRINPSISILRPIDNKNPSTIGVVSGFFLNQNIEPKVGYGYWAKNDKEKGWTTIAGLTCHIYPKLKPQFEENRFSIRFSTIWTNQQLFVTAGLSAYLK